MEKQKRLLIVDGLNIYMRSYIANPSISTNGDPIGGCKGFLMSLQKIVRNVNPDRIVVVWDGNGGSARKRKLCPGYKGGRKPVRLNRAVRDLLTEAQEQANKAWQYTNTIDYLDLMPVTQICINGFEADDIISMISGSPKYKGWQKVIISSDKDFLQLLDGETVLYRPIQKKAWTKNTVIEEYGISPENFVIARAIAGDKSDNLAGIKGAGLPTIAKRLSFLIDDEMHTLNEVYDHCANAEGKLKFYERIVEDWDRVETNYKVMNLTPPSISVHGRKKVNYALDNFEFELNATELKKCSVDHGFGSYDWSELMAMLRGVVEKNKLVA